VDELLYQVGMQTLRLTSHIPLSSSDMPAVDLAVTASSHKALAGQGASICDHQAQDGGQHAQTAAQTAAQTTTPSSPHTGTLTSTQSSAHAHAHTALDPPPATHEEERHTLSGGGQGIAAVAPSVKHHRDHHGGRGPSPEEDEGGGKRGGRAQQKGCESQSERGHLLPCASTHTMPPPSVAALALPPSRSPPCTPPSRQRACLAHTAPLNMPLNTPPLHPAPSHTTCLHSAPQWSGRLEADKRQTEADTRPRHTPSRFKYHPLYHSLDTPHTHTHPRSRVPSGAPSPHSSPHTSPRALPPPRTPPHPPHMRSDHKDGSTQAVEKGGGERIRNDFSVKAGSANGEVHHHLHQKVCVPSSTVVSLVSCLLSLVSCLLSLVSCLLSLVCYAKMSRPVSLCPHVSTCQSCLLCPDVFVSIYLHICECESS